MNNYNYLTLGYDCSPAAALRNLGLREFALPFDWTVSTVFIIQQCLEDKFNKFHLNLNFNYSKKRLIDDYGFQFPHDYPLTNNILNQDELGEGVIGEEAGKNIVDNWKDYHNIVIEKYKRRIQRFLHIMNDTKPIIVLTRYNTNDIIQLADFLTTFYNKKNIYFINSSQEIFENNFIKNIYTEKNGEWNDVRVWKEHLTNYIENNKETIQKI